LLYFTRLPLSFHLCISNPLNLSKKWHQQAKASSNTSSD